MTGEKERRLGEKTWWKKRAESVLQAEGTKPLKYYINKRQATLADWLTLRPILKVCANETGYNEGGRFLETWWQQATAEKYLK